MTIYFSNKNNYRESYADINHDKGMKYVNDGDNESFPWYDWNAIVTLEGPTSKHSVVEVLVSIFDLGFFKFYK